MGAPFDGAREGMLGVQEDVLGERDWGGKFQDPSEELTGRGPPWGETDDFEFQCRFWAGRSPTVAPASPLPCKPSQALGCPAHLVHKCAHEVDEADLQLGELGRLVPVHHGLKGEQGHREAPTPP